MHRSGGHDLDADQRVGYRLATASDIDAYYGSRPIQTIRAVVLTLNDAPSMIFGLAYEGRHIKAFSEYKPEYKPYLRSMATLRAIKAVMRWVEQSRLPVVAVAQPDEPDSPRFLERIGFVFLYPADDGDVYEWRG